jgi:hypothetical protein
VAHSVYDVPAHDVGDTVQLAIDNGSSNVTVERQGDSDLYTVTYD